MERRTTTDVSCVFPYRQIHFDAQGVFGPCCQFIKRKSLSKYNTISDYLNSEELQEIKNRLNSGEKIENCKFCWTQENSNISSMRQRKQNLNIDSIKELFITFGNQCNTACRICNASRSSLIGKYNNQYADKVDDLDLKKLLSVKHDWDKGKIWYKNLSEDTLKIVDHLELIQISGGEPFINVHFDKFINTLINSNKQLPRISITTNGSFTKEQIDKLSKFKQVDILFSVDGLTKDFYEYLRWPLKYNDLKEKIDILKNISYNINVDFQLVMHNLNLSHISEAILFFEEEFSKNKNFRMSFTLLNGAEWYSLHNSPKYIRDREIEKLKNISWEHNRIKPTKEQIISYLEQDFEYKKLDMLINHISYTDNYRNFDTWKFLGWHPRDLQEKQ